MLVDSANGIPGDKVTLLSPTYSADMRRTLTFDFCMHLDSSDETAALSIYTYSPLKAFEKLLWTASRNNGRSWLTYDVCIPSGNYSFAFVATIGIPYLSDIAIDHIVLSPYKSWICDQSSQDISVLGKCSFSLSLEARDL
jgi:MAM domain, meprin/A5/mu